MKKTILVLLTTLFTLNPSLITTHTLQIALSDDIFDPEIEKQIMEEGAKKSKERAEAKKRAEEEAKKQAERIVFVKGGTFDMGDNILGTSDPIHKVTLSSFYISKYETTQSEYQAIMGSNPSHFNGDNLPVESVSWFDAIKYCNAKSKKDGLSVAYNETSGELLDSGGNVTSDITKVKGYRLPTEAEWEYAAGGGNKSQGYKYSGSNYENEVAWFSSNSGGKTHEIGTKKSNELGIYDMSGNVYEWCTDFFDDNYYNNSATINPVNTKSSDDRVNRGSSWSNNDDYLRVCTRHGIPPTYDNTDLGLRLVRTY